MPSNKVACPHCGHDGTIVTSRPPLGSYGFNYLADGVITREERGPDEGSGVRAPGEIQDEGSHGTGAALECRSCWRTFPIPGGLQWAVTPLSATESETGSAGMLPDVPVTETMETAAGAITRSLLVLLRNMMQEAEQAGALQNAKLDADLTALREQASSAAMVQEMWLGRIAAVEAAVRAQQANYQEILERMQNHGLTITRLEQQTGEFRQAVTAGLDALANRVTSLDGLQERVAGLDESLRTEKEGVDQVRTLCTQLQAENQALQQRLDAQAAVIRGLHSAAIEQTTRREELRAAVQRLEELTSSESLMHPLPEQL